MPELLFCSNGTLFCGVPCFRLIMVLFYCHGWHLPFSLLSWSGHDTRKMMSLFCFFSQTFCSTEKNVWNTLHVQLYSGIGIVADLPTSKRQKS